MSTPSIAETDYLRGIADELRNAKHGQKEPIIERAYKYLAISRPELYRRLETVGYTSGRKTRSDKGNTIVSDAAAEFVGGAVTASRSKLGKKRLPATVALEIAIANGIAPQVSASTMSRAMKQKFCHPEQLALPTPHIQQRSLHPNHVWQVDASICVVFYLQKSGMCVMDERQFYKNKPGNIAKIEKERVVRYVIADHTSGSFYHQYMWGSENTENLTNFFLDAIQLRSLKEPMHGVPFILFADQGSANTAGLFKNLLERLQVQFIAHATNNSRAKGTVEQCQNLIETQYEGTLAFKHINNIDELNADATQWRIFFNDNHVHSRTKVTRNQAWLRITPQQLRKAPALELCRELVSTMPVTRIVNDGLRVKHTIKAYGEHFYKVGHIDGIYIGATVSVVVNPYRAPDIDVIYEDRLGNPVVYTCQPDQLDMYGFDDYSPVIGQAMQGAVLTEVDNARNRIMKKAYNADTIAAVDKAIKKRTPAYDGQIDPNAHITRHAVVEMVPRAGELLHTPTIRQRELPPLSVEDAALEIVGLVGDLWTADYFRALKNQYPDGNVPPEAVRSFADNILNQGKRPTLKVVGG